MVIGITRSSECPQENIFSWPLYSLTLVLLRFGSRDLGNYLILRGKKTPVVLLFSVGRLVQITQLAVLLELELPHCFSYRNFLNQIFYLTFQTAWTQFSFSDLTFLLLAALFLISISTYFFFPLWTISINLKHLEIVTFINVVEDFTKNNL